jgi:hypothetical protein
VRWGRGAWLIAPILDTVRHAWHPMHWLRGANAIGGSQPAQRVPRFALLRCLRMRGWWRVRHSWGVGAAVAEGHWRLLRARTIHRRRRVASHILARRLFPVPVTAPSTHRWRRASNRFALDTGPLTVRP